MESNQLTLKFKEFDNFLETIGSCITDEMWQSMRQFLLGMNDKKPYSTGLLQSHSVMY